MSTSLPRSPRRFARPVIALAVLGAAVGASVLVPAPAGAAAGSADLSVTVSHDPDSPLSGEPVTFTLRASNAGPDAAATVVAGLSFGYPFSYTAVPSTTSPACRITQSQPALICTLGTLAAGASTSVAVTLTPTSAGVFPVPVVVSSPTPDPDAADRTATDTVLVQPGPSQLERAVTSYYPLLLGRPASAGEIAYWTTVFQNTSYDLRYRVPLAIIAGTEHRAIRIKAAYAAILGRQPSKADVTYWSGQLAKGLRFESLQATLIGSAEFRRSHGSVSATADAAFTILVGRSATAAEIRAWAAGVSQGRSSGSQAAALTRTTEARNRIMEARYQTTLERRPDDFERFLWFSAMLEGESSDQQWARLLSGFSYLRQFPEVYDGYITPVFD